MRTIRGGQGGDAERSSALDTGYSIVRVEIWTSLQFECFRTNYNVNSSTPWEMIATVAQWAQVALDLQTQIYWNWYCCLLFVKFDFCNGQYKKLQNPNFSYCQCSSSIQRHLNIFKILFACYCIVTLLACLLACFFCTIQTDAQPTVGSWCLRGAVLAPGWEKWRELGRWISCFPPRTAPLLYTSRAIRSHTTVHLRTVGTAAAQRPAEWIHSMRTGTTITSWTIKDDRSDADPLPSHERQLWFYS